MSTTNKTEQKTQKKAKLVFASRLAPRKDAPETNELGIPVSSELAARLPVVVAAGRTTRR